MTQHQAPEVTSEPDLSWIDIAVCRNATVIADYSPGWNEFFDSTDLHVEDCIDTSTLMPTEVGLYRWSGYHIRYWDEGDLANLSGGTFTRATQPLSLTVDEEMVAQIAAAIRFAINPLDGDPIGVMVHNYEFLQADDNEAQIALVDEVCAVMARAALDRLQSLSLPVED